MTDAKKLGASVGVVFFLLLLFFLLFHVVDNSGNVPVVQGLWQALLIGDSLLRYQDDHNGNLPNHLSDLVPRYVNPSNIFCFFWPRRPELVATNLQVSNKLLNQIDGECAFIYLGTHGFKENLILFDRTNLWPQNPDATCVVTLTTNLTTRWLSVNDIDTRLHSLSIYTN